MSVERKNYPQLAKPVGPYVHAVKHAGLVFLSGLTAFGTPAHGDTLAKQAEVIFSQIKSVASAEGTSLKALLKEPVSKHCSRSQFLLLASKALLSCAKYFSRSMARTYQQALLCRWLACSRRKSISKSKLCWRHQSDRYGYHRQPFTTPCRQRSPKPGLCCLFHGEYQPPCGSILLIRQTLGYSDWRFSARCYTATV